jgi:hypothetical protein
MAITDPRLSSLVDYVQSTVLPDANPAAGALGILASRIGDLEAQVAVLQRTHTDPIVMTGSGAPVFTPPKDGTLYVDVTSSRLYVRSASVWKSVLIS